MCRPCSVSIWLHSKPCLLIPDGHKISNVTWDSCFLKGYWQQNSFFAFITIQHKPAWQLIFTSIKRNSHKRLVRFLLYSSCRLITDTAIHGKLLCWRHTMHNFCVKSIGIKVVTVPINRIMRSTSIISLERRWLTILHDSEYPEFPPFHKSSIKTLFTIK